MWSSWLEHHLITEGSQVWLSVRAHAPIVGLILGPGAYNPGSRSVLEATNWCFSHIHVSLFKSNERMSSVGIKKKKGNLLLHIEWLHMYYESYQLCRWLTIQMIRKNTGFGVKNRFVFGAWDLLFLVLWHWASGNLSRPTLRASTASLEGLLWSLEIEYHT